jgi:hypothetical protein
MKKFYTASQYVDEIKPQLELGGVYSVWMPFFSSHAEADAHTQWLVDYSIKEGKRIRKPVVYQVKFVKVAKKRARKAGGG